MFYVTYNKPKNISNNLMDRAVKFASEFLDIDTFLEIDFEGEFNDGCCGYCNYEKDDEELTVHVKPNMKRKEIIATLFHEMVHAKQYLNGELVSGVGKNPSLWKGKECVASYAETPWEQEAYELEAVMFDIFKERQA